MSVIPRRLVQKSGRLARWLLLATAIVPLVWAPVVVLPGVVPRALVFRFLVAAALVATIPPLIAGHLSGRARRLLEDPAVWILGAFVAVSVGAGLVNSAPLRSLFGTLDRMWGVVSWIHLLVFYCLLRLWIREEDWWTRYLTVAVAASTAYAAALLAGEAGWISIPIPIPLSAYAYPVLSYVFGNPSPAAAYLMVGLFLIGVLYQRVRERRLRGILVAAGALHVIGIPLLEARAVMLGTGIGVATALGILAARRWKPRAIRRFLLGTGGLVVALAAADVLVGPGVLEAFLESMLSESSMGERRMAWTTALDGIARRPVLGFGPENFQVAFERFFDPAWYDLALGDKPAGFVSNLAMDRAHNAYLRAFVEAGILGGLLFAALVALYVRRALRVAREAAESGPARQGIALLGLGIGMAVYLFFWFEDFGSFPLYLAALALAAHLRGAGRDRSTGEGTDSARCGEGRDPPGATVRWSVGVLLSIFGLASFVHGAEIYRAAREADLAGRVSAGSARVRHYAKALEIAPPGAHQHLALQYARGLMESREALLRRAGDPGASAAGSRAIELGLSAMEKAIRRDPEKAELRFHLAILQYTLAHPYHRDTVYANRSLERVREAIALAPGRMHYRHTLALMLLSEGRPRQASRALGQALDRYADLPRTHELQAVALYQSGRLVGSARHLLAARELGNDRTLRSDLGTALSEALATRGREGLARELRRSGGNR